MADRGRSVRGAGAFLLALSLLALVPAVPALGLSATACRVKDTESSVTKPSLQAAVTAARKGHHLIVRGVCHGITVIGKDLTITGIRPAGAARHSKIDIGASATRGGA